MSLAAAHHGVSASDLITYIIVGFAVVFSILALMGRR